MCCAAVAVLWPAGKAAWKLDDPAVLAAERAERLAAAAEAARRKVANALDKKVCTLNVTAALFASLLHVVLPEVSAGGLGLHCTPKSLWGLCLAHEIVPGRQKGVFADERRCVAAACCLSLGPLACVALRASRRRFSQEETGQAWVLRALHT
jgi:hypothetical protein